MAKKYVGIDFGACNIKAAMDNGKKSRSIKLNKKQSGGVQIPNVIWYDAKTDKNGKQTGIEIKVGTAAKKALVSDTNKVDKIKRKLELPKWSAYIPNLQKEVSATDVATDIFSWLNDTINNNLSEENLPTAITIPVCFSEVQRKRIENSARAANINVAAVITEPFAALFSQEDLFEDEELDENIFIFDFGGSTLDLSLLHVENDGEGSIEVTELASAGMHYGGMNIDEDIYTEIFKPKYAKELAAIQATDDINNSKVELLEKITSLKETIFVDDEDEADDIYIARSGKEYELLLTQEEILNMFEKTQIKQRIISIIDEIFESTDEIEKEDVTRVKAVGGTSAISYFREILAEYFDDENVFDSGDFDTDEAYTSIAVGAAKYLALKNEKDSDRTIEIHNSIPFNIGIANKNRFEKYINRNELYGFETPYRPLLIADLVKMNYCVPIYQSFSFDDDIALNDESVVFMGDIKLEKNLYSAQDAILFTVKMSESGQLNFKTYELVSVNGEEEIQPRENKLLVIGG